MGVKNRENRTSVGCSLRRRDMNFHYQSSLALAIHIPPSFTLRLLASHTRFR